MIFFAKSKVLLYSFRQFLYQILKDAMLVMALAAPFLMGIFIRYGIPLGEKLLTAKFHQEAVLEPYYLIFDLFLAVLIPLMYCFIAAMVLLEEIDDKISNYMAVTPLGKNGYLISRLGISTAISLLVTVICIPVFSLTMGVSVLMIGISILSCLSGFIESLMVVSLSANKVEGMAVVKLTGIITLGIPAPFFITGKIQYILLFLPSFWIGKYAATSNFFYFVIGIGISAVWIIFLWEKFDRKLI